MRFDLYQNQHLARRNEAILKVKVSGIDSIADGESLLFNVDGKITGLRSIDMTTDWEKEFYTVEDSWLGSRHIEQRFSTKRYVISEQLIDRIASAERVVARVNLSREYVEGVLHPVKAGSAKDQELVNEMSGTTGLPGAR